MGPPNCQDWLWVEEKSQWPTVINETYKDSKGHGWGTQVIDRKVWYSVTKGEWKDLQDDTKEVEHDFEDIPILERQT
jgi:uncharacterized protein (UPF0335 family)